jgi:hypothetical protein
MRAECSKLSRCTAGGGPAGQAQYIGTAQPDRLEAAAAQRLQAYIDNLAARSEGQGRAQAAAWWKVPGQRLYRPAISIIDGAMSTPQTSSNRRQGLG